MVAKTAKVIDWAKVEAEYRTGRWTVREIAKRNEITHPPIIQRAKKYGWVQDISQKVEHARKEKLAQQAMVETNLADTVDAVATQQADIVSQHKTAASKARAVVDKLLAEVDFTTEHRDLFRDALAASGFEGFDKLSIQQALTKVLGLGGRSMALQRVINSLATVVEIERKAYGIEDAPPPAEESYEDRLKKLIGGEQ